MKTKLSDKEAKLQEREARIEKLSDKIETLSDKVSDLEDNLSAEKRRADRATDDLSRAKRDLEFNEEKNATINQKLKDLQTQADEATHKLKSVTQDYETVIYNFHY